ncbi:hypothetical protein AB4097_18320 [Microvirga sp. 2MCAF35]|uniref:hypothetical protein n=1 Tax=Microvirga sp. 2MCAF35 TaxID=3232987 RepID=UPI003F9E5836
MKFRMPAMARRSDSKHHQFERRVPQDIIERARGQLVVIELPPLKGAKGTTVHTTLGQRVKFSLKTPDNDVAAARTGLVLAHLEKQYDAIRQGPKPLSQKEVIAYSGEAYRLWVERFEENPGSVAEWSAWKAFTRAAMEGRILSAPAASTDSLPNETEAARLQFGEDLTAGINALPRSDDTTALEQRFGQVLSWVLTKHALHVDAATRTALLKATAQASHLAAFRLKRAADGDYSPDDNEKRFPSIPVTGQQSATTLTDLFDRWMKETRPAGSTITTWRSVMKDLKAHLGHENAALITEQDAIAWKDAAIAKGLTPKTVNDSYLAAARRLFTFGMSNRLVSSNPFAKVKVSSKRQAGQKKLPYSNEEVVRLLTLARAETNSARRWLPWLAALTGARIGELAQAWGSQVREVEGFHVLDIKPAPDGGSLKNEGSERTVPLHPALIAEGFLDFAKAKGNGPLFYAGQARKREGDSNRHASKGVTNRLSTWIREQGFNDPRKAPAHALRHWWKSAAARARVQESEADAIQGHAGKSDASTYRHFDIATLAAAVSAIPSPLDTETGGRSQEAPEASKDALRRPSEPPRLP